MLSPPPPNCIGWYWLLQWSNSVSIGSHIDQTSFQFSSLYLWALGKHCFVKMSSSTLCCTVFLYHVFALSRQSEGSPPPPDLPQHPTGRVEDPLEWGGGVHVKEADSQQSLLGRWTVIVYDYFLFHSNNFHVIMITSLTTVPIYIIIFFIMYFGLRDTKPPPCPLHLTKQGGSIHCWEIVLSYIV